MTKMKEKIITLFLSEAAVLHAARTGIFIFAAAAAFSFQ